MNKLAHMLLGSLLGLAGLFAVPAQAASGLSPSARPASGASDVVEVEVVCDRYGCYDTRRRRPPPAWDDGYRRPPPPPPPIYRRPPPPPPPVYGGRNWSRHVEWCLNRYRSYNPQTNRFLSTSGYFKVCRSPYY